MDSVAVTVPLRPPMKKMKKRKELDALAPPRAILRRGSGKRSSQELLTDSSDDRSEYWNISTRGTRKCKDRRSRACPGLLRACSAFLACASVLATASLIWLFIDVRQQLTALRTELDQVIAGNEGVPDALQKCHSLSRDLQNNQTIIFTNLSDLKLQINNFTVQLVGIQHNLQQVQDWFQAAPQLANVPENLKAISTSVATFGSQIRDLDIRSETLKQNNAKVQAIQEAMQKNLTSLEKTVQDLANIAQKPQLSNANETKIKTDELKEAILNLAHNVTHINKTLSSLIQFNVEDQRKDHGTLVSLQDKTQEVSTKVLSLQKECAKVSDQSSILMSIQNITTQVNEMNETDKKFTERLNKLEQSYYNLQNTSSSISPTMTARQPIMRAKRTSNNNLLDGIAVPTTHDKLLDGENSPQRSRRDTN